MIRLNKNSNYDVIILTLTDSISLTNPYLLFVFNNDTTRDEVKFIISYQDDQSTSQERYNKFIFNTSSLFSQAPRGDYKYFVYEQESADNLNTEGLVDIENGKMQLIGEAQSYIENDIDITFIQNNG